MNTYPSKTGANISKRIALGSTVVAVALALAGCATGTPGAVQTSVPSAGATTSAGSSVTPAAELDVCSLLTADQASSLVGETLSAGVSSTIATGQDQCVYSSSSSVGLTVLVYLPSSAVPWAILLDDSGADKPVSGVGDTAKTDGVVELDVQSGDYLIAIQNTSDAGRIAVAKEIVGALK
ncbi:MAG: hypothetical protein ABJA94_04485 [Rhodoglobus sp.]